MVFIKIIGELGQLSRPEHRLGLDHEGQVFFRVALADVQVEHVGNQGAL